MNQENTKKVEFLIKNTKTILVVTDRGIGIAGTDADILVNFIKLVDNLKETVNEEALKEAFRIAILSDKELEKQVKVSKENLKKEIKDFIESLEKMIGEDKYE